MLVAQNSLGPVCPVPLTVRGIGIGAAAGGFVQVEFRTISGRTPVNERYPAGREIYGKTPLSTARALPPRVVSGRKTK